MAEVSIITVNYNGFADTCELIESLRKYETYPYELIVVDNGSTKDESILIKQLYPDIKTIRSDENLGFAGGNNLGIEYASTGFCLFLNNDVIIDRPFLKPMIQLLASRETIGVVSPKIKFTAIGHPIQFAGYTSLSGITLRNKLIGFMEEDRGQYEKSAPTPYAHGAAMMVRREVIEKAGRMPELFFLYYEELDWCEQITRCGYEIWYEPQSLVYHKESASTGQNSPLRTFYLTRNRLLYARRNRKGVERYLSLLYQSGVVFPRDVLKYVLQRRVDLLLAVCQGVRRGLTMKKGDSIC